MVTLTGNAGQVPEVETDLSVSIAYISPAGVSILAGMITSTFHCWIKITEYHLERFSSQSLLYRKNDEMDQQHAGTGKILLDAYWWRFI